MDQISRLNRDQVGHLINILIRCKAKSSSFNGGKIILKKQTRKGNSIAKRRKILYQYVRTAWNSRLKAIWKERLMFSSELSNGTMMIKVGNALVTLKTLDLHTIRPSDPSVHLLETNLNCLHTLHYEYTFTLQYLVSNYIISQNIWLHKSKNPLGDQCGEKSTLIPGDLSRGFKWTDINYLILFHLLLSDYTVGPPIRTHLAPFINTTHFTKGAKSKTKKITRQ